MYINIWTQLAKLMRKVNKQDVQEFIPSLDLQNWDLMKHWDFPTI